MDERAEARQLEDENFREVSKMSFEFFKHFTTIATAAALIELAVYQQFQLDGKRVIVGVVMLGLTLLLSIMGMLYIPLRANEKGELPKGGVYQALLMLATADLFVLGIAHFAYFTAFPDTGSSGSLIYAITSSVVLTLLFSPFLLTLTRRHETGNRNEKLPK